MALNIAPRRILLLACFLGAGCAEPDSQNVVSETEKVVAAIDNALAERPLNDQREWRRTETSALREKIAAMGIDQVTGCVVVNTFDRGTTDGAREFLFQVLSVGTKPAKVRVLRRSRIVAEASIPRLHPRTISPRAEWQTIFINFVQDRDRELDAFKHYPTFTLEGPGGVYDVLLVDETGNTSNSITLSLGDDNRQD